MTRQISNGVKSKKIILGLVGNPASGKGIVAEYLKNKYHASSHRFSTMLDDILNRLYLEITRRNLQLTSTMIRKNFGEDIMARVMAEDVKNDKNKIIVVDGARRVADIKYLKKIPGFKLIKVEANIKVRFQRLLKRTEKKDDTKKTFKQFLADHKREADREVPQLMKRADMELDNDGSLKNLYKQIDKMIKKLI